MNKLSKDIIISTVFPFLNVLLNFWLIKEAEYLLSALALSVFLIMRRVVPTFTNLSQLGTSQALIRFVSINKDDEDKIKTYFAISFTIWIISSLLLAMLYFGFGAKLGIFLYDEIQEAQNVKLYFLLTVWYISIVHLSYLVQPYFLAKRKVFLYNIINMLNASLILLVVIKLVSATGLPESIGELVGRVDLTTILVRTLIVMSGLQLCLMIHIIIQLKIYNYPTLNKIKSYGKEFMLYGIPRSVITFADMFLLTVSAFMISNGKEEITAFLLALTLARIVLIVLQPVSKLSSVIVGNNNSEERQKTAINLMTGTTLYGTLLLIIILYNWLNVLIDYWLSDAERITQVLAAFKILALGLIPYAIFHGLKGIIEIKFFKPYNLFSIIIAIVLHVGLYYLLEGHYEKHIALSISLMIGFVALGVATAYWCRKDFNGYKYYRLEILLLLGFVLFVINYYINAIYPNIYACILSVIGTTVMYTVVLLFSKVKFLNETINVLLKRERKIGD